MTTLDTLPIPARENYLARWQYHLEQDAESFVQQRREWDEKRAAEEADLFLQREALLRGLEALRRAEAQSGVITHAYTATVEQQVRFEERRTQFEETRKRFMAAAVLIGLLLVLVQAWSGVPQVAAGIAFGFFIGGMGRPLMDRFEARRDRENAQAE